MKILHISTFDSGGAGRAAIRLHQALLNAGVDSKFLCLDKKTNIKNVIQFRYKTPLLKKTLNKLELSKVQRLQKLLYNQKGVYETFTFPVTDIDVSNHQLVRDVDIINLHWISWFVDYKTFFKKVKKPIVWTLHDKNPFQGGFHLHNDKINNKWKLEKELEEFKTKILSKHYNLNIVALNKEMLDYSENSNIFKNRYHTIIYNGIEDDIFTPKDKIKVRKLLGIPFGKIVFAFIAESDNRINKGLDLLLEIVNNFNPEKVIFYAIGNIEKRSDINIRYFGKIENDNKLASIYSAVDAVIIPSREDNLPNVLLEALSCGTPVIGTPVGGILDIINNGVNGYITNYISSVSIMNSLNLFIKNKDMFNREKIREFSINKFSLSLQARKYIELYKKILLSNL